MLCFYFSFKKEYKKPDKMTTMRKASKTRPNYLPVQEILTRKDQCTDIDLKRDSRKALFFAGFIYCRFNDETKEVEFLVLNYRENGTGPLQIKFPGGCSELGETALEACIREAGMEVGFKPAKETLWLVHNNQIANETGEVVHIKTFFVSKKIGAAVKTKTGSDGGEASPVYYMEAQELVHHLFKSHREAFYKACLKLASENREYASCLSSTLEYLAVEFE